jgi:hypothetical protein
MGRHATMEPLHQELWGHSLKKKKTFIYIIMSMSACTWPYILHYCAAVFIKDKTQAETNHDFVAAKHNLSILVSTECAVKATAGEEFVSI